MSGSADPERPRLAVCIASNRPLPLLRQTLASLEPFMRAGGPVVVARPHDLEWESVDRLPSVLKHVPAPSNTNIPRLRGMALAAAPEGHWVALIEDHCTVAPKWADRLLEAIAADGATGMSAAGPPSPMRPAPSEERPDGNRGGTAVWGGDMENGLTNRWVDWAAFFAEYGFFVRAPDQSPFAAKRTDASAQLPLITGANATYAPWLRHEVAEWCVAGEWENVIHDRLWSRGESLGVVPGATVATVEPFGVGAFLANRFRHGHDYARKRRAEHPSESGVALAARAPLVPTVLAWRIGRSASRRYPRTWWLSLPLTWVFLAAWTTGEIVGYLRGAKV